MMSNKTNTHKSQVINRFLSLLMCASVLLGAVAAVPASPVSAASSPASQLPSAGLPQGETPADQLPNYHQIVIKFKSGLGLSYNSGRLDSSAGADLTLANTVLGGQTLQPYFSGEASAVAASDAGLDGASSGLTDAAATLQNYYLLSLPDSTSYADARQTLASIQALDSVETAYMEPYYKVATTDIDPKTPSYIDKQLYLQDDQLYAPVLSTTIVAGALGENVDIWDVEYGWQLNHEDMALSSNNLIGTNSSDTNDVNHGTAVAGILTAGGPYSVLTGIDFGVLGIVPNSTFHMVSATNIGVTNALYNAYVNSQPGDIIVLPIQAVNVDGLSGVVLNPTCPAGCTCTDTGDPLPVEAVYANYELIKLMTAGGRTVVEAAGNGLQNLDNITTTTGSHPIFRRGYRDSGAILVGAGNADHAAVCTSNYGTRIDLQGWGENVVTTGYNDASNPNVDFAITLPTPSDARQYYTNTFGGTSAAAAMVAGAAASLQGVAQISQGVALDAKSLRKMLVDSATQVDVDVAAGEHSVGDFPSITGAINKYFPNGGLPLIYPENRTALLNTLRPTLDWRSFIGVSSYDVQVSKNDVNFTSPLYSTTVGNSQFTIPANLAKNTLYFWRVKPTGSTKWTEPFQFLTANYSGPASSATLKYPKSGKLYTVANMLPVYFQWSSVSGATGYQIQISTSDDMSETDAVNTAPTGDEELNVRDQVTTTQYFPDADTFKPVGGKRYYWRVRPYNVIGGDAAQYFGAWTGWRVYYTKPDAPEELSSPEDLAVVHTRRPTLQFSVVDNALKYQIQVSPTTSFKSNVKSYYYFATALDTDTISYTPPADLPLYSRLYWRVRVLGKYITTSSGWSSWNVGPDPSEPGLRYAFFPKYTPSKPVLKSPAANKTIKTLSVTLKWKRPTRFATRKALPSGLPSGFQIEVYAAEDPTTPMVSQYIYLYTMKSTTAGYVLDGLDAGAAYYWRVRAFNNCEDVADAAKCDYSDWTSYRVFRTSADAE